MILFYKQSASWTWFWNKSAFQTFICCSFVSTGSEGQQRTLWDTHSLTLDVCWVTHRDVLGHAVDAKRKECFSSYVKDQTFTQRVSSRRNHCPDDGRKFSYYQLKWLEGEWNNSSKSLPNKSLFKESTRIYSSALCVLFGPEGTAYNIPFCPFVGHFLLWPFSSQRTVI